MGGVQPLEMKTARGRGHGHSPPILKSLVQKCEELCSPLAQAVTRLVTVFNAERWNQDTGKSIEVRSGPDFWMWLQEDTIITTVRCKGQVRQRSVRSGVLIGIVLLWGCT